MVDIPYFCGFAFSTFISYNANDILKNTVLKRKKIVGRVTGDLYAKH